MCRNVINTRKRKHIAHGSTARFSNTKTPLGSLRHPFCPDFDHCVCHLFCVRVCRLVFSASKSCTSMSKSNNEKFRIYLSIQTYLKVTRKILLYCQSAAFSICMQKCTHISVLLVSWSEPVNMQINAVFTAVVIRTSLGVRIVCDVIWRCKWLYRDGYYTQHITYIQPTELRVSTMFLHSHSRPDSLCKKYECAASCMSAVERGNSNTRTNTDVNG